MNSTSIAKLAKGMSDVESRHLQVSADAHVGIPLQIRVMREARGWNQTKLAEKIGTTQNAISRLESGSYGKPNVKTLLRLAKAFDVALLVKFVSFSRFVRTLDEMSVTSVVVPSFGEDKDLAVMMSGAIPKPPSLADADFTNREFPALASTATGAAMNPPPPESSGDINAPSPFQVVADVVQTYSSSPQEYMCA